MATGNETGTRPGDVIVGRIDEQGVPTTDLQTAQWTDFLNGSWQTTRPSSPGIYPVADRDGQIVGEAQFVCDCQGGVMSPTHEGWDGWFYSRPMPRIPNRPPAQFPEESAPQRPTLRLVPSE